MEKLRKTIYDVLVFIISLCITGSISVSNVKTKDTSHVKLTVDETSMQQEIAGWGAAAAWWPQVAGASDNAEEITKLLFSKEGLGLNIYRFNVGAGEKQNPDSRLDRDSWKSTESFLVYNEKTGKYVYDWSQDAESMKILDLAMSYGCVDSVVLFSNSPHFSMTVTGQASGGFKKHQNNLKPECYQEYVDYFLDITEHFIELGYPVKYISPVNEPQASWGGDHVAQEGCHYDTEELFKLYRLFAKSIKARGLDVKLSMCEVSKITSKTFDYLKYIYNDPELREVLGTYAYHAYWSDINYFLKGWWGKYIKKFPGVIYDMSEWCELPVTMSNKSTRSALFMARVMAQDMFISNASIWSAWVAVSEGDEYGDGLIIANHDCSEFYVAQRYYAMAHFSKFVPEGSRLISCTKDVNDRFSSRSREKLESYMSFRTNTAAFLTPDGKIVLVIVNGGEEHTFSLNGIEGRDRLKTYTTDGNRKVKLTYDGEYRQTLTIPAYSITTAIFE